jgi:hypothetical protein
LLRHTTECIDDAEFADVRDGPPALEAA